MSAQKATAGMLGRKFTQTRPMVEIAGETLLLSLFVLALSLFLRPANKNKIRALRRASVC